MTNRRLLNKLAMFFNMLAMVVCAISFGINMSLGHDVQMICVGVLWLANGLLAFILAVELEVGFYD